MDVATEEEQEEAECNGMCLYGADLGVPEYGGLAHAHPDCPAHGDPVEDGPELETCSPGEDEVARYVREENVGGW